jgi:hypothetical protein
MVFAKTLGPGLTRHEADELRRAARRFRQHFRGNFRQRGKAGKLGVKGEGGIGKGERPVGLRSAFHL